RERTSTGCDRMRRAGRNPGTHLDHQRARGSISPPQAGRLQSRSVPSEVIKMEMCIVGVAPGVQRWLGLTRKIAANVAVVSGLLLANARTARADPIMVNGGQLPIGNGQVALDLFAR